MTFEFKSGERKHPKEFGGSPYKALLAEIGAFAKQHRTHSLRRYSGMEKDEVSPSEMVGKGDEECEACAKGACDDPEHMSEDDRGGLEKMLGEREEWED